MLEAKTGNSDAIPHHCPVKNSDTLYILFLFSHFVVMSTRLFKIQEVSQGNHYPGLK